MSQKTKLIISGCFLLVALWRLISFSGGRELPQDILLKHRALGAVSAAAVADMIPEEALVLLITMDSDQSHWAALRKSFTDTLQERNVRSVEMVRLEDGAFSLETGIRKEPYASILADYPDVTGIVSFAGPPPLGESPSVPVFICGFPGQLYLGRYLNSGLIQKAILPASVPPSEPLPTSNDDVDTWFNAYYQWVESPDEVSSPAPEGMSVPPPESDRPF